MSLPGVTTPRIFETTCEWKKYFGIALEELEAFQFVSATFGGEVDSLFDRNPQMRGLLKKAVEREKAAGAFRLD
jgi:hypothetical protein